MRKTVLIIGAAALGSVFAAAVVANRNSTETKHDDSSPEKPTEDTTTGTGTMSSGSAFPHNS